MDFIFINVNLKEAQERTLFLAIYFLWLKKTTNWPKYVGVGHSFFLLFYAYFPYLILSTS